MTRENRTPRLSGGRWPAPGRLGAPPPTRRKPVWNVLEGQFKLLLANPQHLKAIPGKKTDFKDGERIADLMQHGLLHGSFVPPQRIRELRDLTRTRAKLAQERSRIVNRIQKILEYSNIKLASVATDVLGASGRLMIEALIAGERDARKLAELSKGALRGKIPELVAALKGTFTQHHRFLLGLRCINDQAARTLLQIACSVRPKPRGIRYCPLLSFWSSSMPIRTRLAL